MKNTAVWIAAAIYTMGLGLAQEFSGPPQAKKGHDLFFASAGNGAAACGSCHSIKKEGTAVGPDLTRLARLNPRAIVMAINATRTQYVQDVKAKAGEFPGMKVTENAEGYEYYDLSKTPPALVKLAKADVTSTNDNASWRHPASAMKLTPEQLADIITYIKYAAYGDKTGVKPEDVE
ncbi:MAG: c-type cytochrome [Bryobacteraceae bacterium]